MLDIIHDIESTFDYTLELRKRYRKALKHLNRLDSDEKKNVLKSYATLEVSVQYEMNGLEEEEEDKEEEEKEEKEEDSNKEHFWDFVYELRDVLEQDMHILEKYVEKAKSKLKTDIEEDDDDAITMAEHIEDLADDFHTHGADCFKHCSKGKIETISGAVEAMIMPETVEILKVVNPEKLEFVRQLLMPYIKSVRKIGDPSVSIYEKRKTLQKAQVGEGVLKSVKKLMLPSLKNAKNN